MREQVPAMPMESSHAVPGGSRPAASPGDRLQGFGPWLLLLAGLLVMYGPTVFDFLHGPWRGDRNAHGPIVLALSAWFFHFQIKRLREQRVELPVTPAPVLGGSIIVVALGLYVLGRSQGIPLFELGSLIPLLIGVVLVFFGRRVAARFWFAFFLLLFAVPLPASVVDVLTQPMKIAVSIGSEQVLHWLGYPVARSGVIITIGSYQLLVADACAGLNSLFTLEALGLLYMNVMRHESVFRNVTLATLIVPISFSSNLIRVMVLALLTYHFGDETGQGFLHGFSGMVLFLTALMLIIFIDTLLRALSRRLDRRRTA